MVNGNVLRGTDEPGAGSNNKRAETKSASRNISQILKGLINVRTRYLKMTHGTAYSVMYQTKENTNNTNMFMREFTKGLNTKEQMVQNANLPKDSV